jgi:phosphatidate cytidylyltransferase
MNELTKRILTSFFLLFILAISFIEIKILYVLLLAINFLSLEEFIRLFKKIYRENKSIQFLSVLISILYMIAFSLIIIIYLNQSFEINKIKVLFLLFVCIATDIGGFIFGKIIGGKKITKISPNKTYSGLIGSYILALFTGVLFCYIQNDINITDNNIYLFIMIISSISQIGDLIISYFKRKAKIKDTGSFLPGHGGILDRIDGILFAIPIGIIFIYF